MKSLLNTHTKFKIMHIVLRNFKFFIFLFLLSLNLSSYSNAHMRGTFLSEEDARNRSLELGCEGIHKNQDKWMPCKNEKELHKFLNKKGSSRGNNLASSLAWIFILPSSFGILWLSIVKIKRK